jgi:hypothetical protein
MTRFGELTHKITQGIQMIVEWAPIESSFQTKDICRVSDDGLEWRPSARAMDLAINMNLIKTLGMGRYRLTETGVGLRKYLQKENARLHH